MNENSLRDQYGYLLNDLRICFDLPDASLRRALSRSAFCVGLTSLNILDVTQEWFDTEGFPALKQRLQDASRSAFAAARAKTVADNG